MHDLNLFIIVNDIHEHAQVEGKQVSRMVKSLRQHEIYFLRPTNETRGNYGAPPLAPLHPPMRLFAF